MAAATQKIVILADDQTGAAIASAVRNSKKLDRQLQTTNKVMRTTTRQGRAQMGQLGHQVQDIAVQLQMGMNPLMVFAQQGSQIAAVFGAGGAVVGALLATAAAIGSALLPALFKANEEFDKFLGRVKAVTLDLKDMNQATREAVITGAEKEVQKANKAYNDQVKLLDDIIEKIKFYKEKTAGGTKLELIPGFSVSALQGYVRRLKEGRTELAILQKALTTARRKLAELKGEVGMAEKPVFELSNRISSGSVAVNSYNAAHEKLAETIRNKLQTPMGAFMEQQAQMKVLVQEGYLSVEEMNKRLKQLKKELDLLPKDPFKDVKESGIKALEDGLVSLIDGTKSVARAFEDMARSVVSSLARMAVQQAITNPIAQALGLRANGGPVSAGKPYIVGEKGPELMIPRGGGTVVPNKSLGGGDAPVNVTLNISTGVAQTVRTEIMSMLPMITNAAKSAVVDGRRRGGSFARGMS